MTAATAKDIRFDLDLTGRDIQALSAADALAAFFARLGYDTNARIVQTPGNLGIGTEGILRPIKRIELISDREGLFQVYLFELASVTVAHTRALGVALSSLRVNGSFRSYGIWSPPDCPRGCHAIRCSIFASCRTPKRSWPS